MDPPFIFVPHLSIYLFNFRKLFSPYSSTYADTIYLRLATGAYGGYLRRAPMVKNLDTGRRGW